MLFSSIAYLCFFPVVLAAFWLLPHRFRNYLLLVASYYFYMSWIPTYGILLFVLTLGNYFLGSLIAGTEAQQNKKALLTLGVVLNLATLAYFKYTDFAIDSFNKLVVGVAPFLQVNAAELSFPLQHILLPLGISFFVFEFIHYIVDVYKGGAPVKNFVDFSLFAAFFPSQIAGPIKRYQDFIKQMQIPRTFSTLNLERGLALLLQGLFKKIALADNLAPIASQGFSHAASLNCVEGWIVALAFTAQIYCDFSGYTDMGRGSALMLGFELPDNFNLPYIARSLSDFWKRWHISLSSWLRDYLYIPLGGSKCSAARRNFNLVTTMVLGGLWHGASWHFVVWGAFHGFGLVICHAYEHWVKSASTESKNLAQALKHFHQTYFGVALSMVATFLFVIIGWIFFRAEDMPQAMHVLASMAGMASTSSLANASGLAIADGLAAAPGVSTGTLDLVLQVHPVLPALALYSVYAALVKYLPVIETRLPGALTAILTPRAPARVVLYAAAFFVSLGMAPHVASPFIYFAF